MEQADWAELYESAYPRVYRGLIAMGARPDEAEDALHDAFARGLRNVPELTRPEGWIFVVALRAWRRRRFRERMFSPLGLSDKNGTYAPPSTDRVTLLAELARLPVRQRQVFVARYVIGLSQRETASALGMARGTVGSAATQAAASLRKRLGIER